LADRVVEPESVKTSPVVSAIKMAQVAACVLQRCSLPARQTPASNHLIYIAPNLAYLAGWVAHSSVIRVLSVRRQTEQEERRS
jgi:hypothetical protein